MSVGLLPADPSVVVLDAVKDALPSVPVGYDMPAGSRKVLLTLDGGAPMTAVSQHWTLTVSSYCCEQGAFDHARADDMWRNAVRSLLAHRRDDPLIDVDLQSGPIVNHDADLDVDYVYGALMLTVAMQ